VKRSITDAHHHIWRFAKTPWLNGPPVPRIFGGYEPLRRDYSIEEFASDVRPAGVTKSVYVQVNVAEGEEVEEVAWVWAEGRRESLAQGIVGFAELSNPEVGETLDQQLACGRLRGIRQQLHWHQKSEYRFALTPDSMADSRWRRGLAEVAKRGLLFELQVFPSQYQHALALVDAFPQLTFVLLHAGMPEDRSPEALDNWRLGLALFAARPNVVTKLSGLGTFTRSCDEALWRPIIEDTVTIFGPRRCMFGSNFPIEKLWTDYETLIAVFQSSIRNFSEEEQQQILSGTAERIYRI
jgi:predicted TIM-barrel fold metal-dependent hydrolase